MKYTVGISIPAKKSDGTNVTLNVGDIIDVSGKSANGGYYLAKDSSGNDVQFPVKFWRQITPTNPPAGITATTSPYHSGKPPVSKKNDNESSSGGWFSNISTTTKILAMLGLAGGIVGGAYYAHKNPNSTKKVMAYIAYGALGTVVGFGTGTAIGYVKK